MGTSTKIAWCSHTANFWLGCQRWSPGCEHCFAETLTKNRMGLHVWGPPSTTRRQPVKSVWANVRRWNREAVRSPAAPGSGEHTVFVGSLMDWAEDHPDAAAIRPEMWKLIKQSPHLRFQMLTKRADRIAALLPTDWGPHGYHNVWLGTSVENQQYADERIPLLMNVPAVVHFVSYEPALGPIDMRRWLTPHDRTIWTICGAESGPGYRPMDLQWARDVRDQCAAADTPFFYKQGNHRFTERNIELDGQIVREYPTPRLTRLTR
jgi:protein gp37